MPSSMVPPPVLSGSGSAGYSQSQETWDTPLDDTTKSRVIYKFGQLLVQDTDFLIDRLNRLVQPGVTLSRDIHDIAAISAQYFSK